ncbi:hypothetical protein [Dysgonomonas sp. 511]|uniref:hypothetical protein n=1 Tax=Dysgonomonas sp. 511 TaxID=2302930 RepID=UPI0013D083D5|nr:hypothetical protein [Dysgonomonas sp. 511]NDV79238.1 hypothetical protein [Dysgonomonas sp. 511]
MFLIILSCSGSKQSEIRQDSICDTTIIDETPIFYIKDFAAEQTETVRFYLLDGSFKFRAKGSAKAYRIGRDSINDLSIYKFGFSGFGKTDTLVFRTHDDLFFLFTNYHYIHSSGCTLSDTVTVNGKLNIGSTISPDMGIPRDSLDAGLSARFYWDDMI